MNKIHTWLHGRWAVPAISGVAIVASLIADMQSVDGWRTEFLPWGSGLMLCVRD